jgi:GntR family transcriptional regulator/MocR family aminotransferase
MSIPLSPPGLADAAALALTLDRAGSDPLSLQLARQISALILAGRITEGARLPSTRSLAADLDVSRSTIVEAFDQLAAEGYLEGRRGSGMFVTARSAPEAGVGRPPARFAPAPTRAAAPRPFEIGIVDVEVAPFGEMARLLQRNWRRPSAKLLRADDPFGLWDLRQAIAGHLAQWRGFAPDPERIVITAGLADALELIVRAALPHGGAAFVEDPGHSTLRHRLAQLGVTPAPVSVDADGVDISRAPEGVRALAAFVTPSRQFPLGFSLPVSRRLALIEWARQQDALIVEDDFDSEYRYVGAPLPALASLDGRERVLYLGSFSKVLFSGLRLGFLVAPERLVAATRQQLTRRGPVASILAQPALAEFIASGRYGAHIRRSRRLYARRARALVGEAERVRAFLHFAPIEAGLHAFAELSAAMASRFSDRAVSAALAEVGVAAAPLSDFYMGEPKRAGLIFGFAAFSDSEIGAAMRKIGERVQGLYDQSSARPLRSTFSTSAIAATTKL